MNLFEILKKNGFSILAATLALILVVNLFGGFTKIHLFWKNWTDHSLVTNGEEWQTWLNTNRELFASLSDNAQIGVTKNLNGDYGVIWTKLRDRMQVFRTTQLKETGPGIILEFDDEVAKDLQWKKNKDEAIIFLRHRARIGKIQTYYLKDNDKLNEEGFLQFLRDIGLRPL